MRHCYRHLYLLLVFLLLVACDAAGPNTSSYLETIPNPKKLGEKYVSDPDNLLNPATIEELNTTLQALDQSGRAHIDVVLVNSIGEETPKAAATALFNRWKIGDKEKDNGLLMLLVLDQRRIEFETGYGLEADLPDVLCYRIQQRYMIPPLRAGRYDEAVQQGVAATIRQLQTGAMDASDPPDNATLDSLGFDSEGSEVVSYSNDSEMSPTPTTVGDPAPESNEWLSIASFFGAFLALPLYGFLWHFTTAAADKFYRRISALGILLPFGILLVNVRLAGAINGWFLVSLYYWLPLLYVHAHLALVNFQLRTKHADIGRYWQYVHLQKAHHNLGFLRFLFPILLAFYWPWHRRRMQELRETPHNCPTCAIAMHKLSEEADDEQLEPGQVAEEMVESVDYDVWRCGQCQYQLELAYQNLGTKVKACPSCEYVTYKMRNKEIVRHASTSSSGWGWEHHRCEHCSHAGKEKFTIPQESSSSSSSSSGSSSSSSSSSSSGGSSGGGGAGSSW